ncbi:MAG: GerMN domain-containing protein [Eubacterium sp.]|nr:GerMN domain-containing protein [Eubacterium sp.]
MKKFLTLLIITSYVCMLVGCSDEVQEAGVYQIYYLDADSYGFKQEEYHLPQAKQDIISVVQVLFEQLQSPKSKDEKSPIDDGISVVDYQIKETQLSVSFSAGYNNKSGIDEILSRAAIVKTLCQLNEIDYVEFYVEDQPLMVNGKAVGMMSGDDFIDELDPTDQEQSKLVSLYFANKEGTSLKKVTTKITYNAAEPLAKLMVQSLIIGSDEWNELPDQNVMGTIPADTVLNNLTIRDNICYIDFSKHFIEDDNSVKVPVRVYSVVNTLCDLPNISSVQFTIDGEQRESFGDVQGFNLPLQRNLDLVRE